MTVPRRWNVDVDGIRWLPRMIDKARMSATGNLGAYLIGHSPVDHALLTRLGLSTDEFVAIAAARSDDVSVLQTLREHGMDEPRVRRWSDNFERIYRRFIWMWDVDEGYVRPNPAQGIALAIYRPIQDWVSALLRKLLPAP
jgi:uncharacterized protein DUF5069